MQTGKRKIVHVIDSLGTGGAEMLLLNTIKELDEFDHVVVALNKPEGLIDYLKPGTKYYRLRFNYRINALGTMLRLKKIIRAEKPDIIHAHLYWSIILARLAKGKGTKFIFTLHGMMGTRLFKGKGIYWILERLTVSKNQHLVAVSETVYHDYLKYIPFKGTAHIVYNYAPDEYFNNKKVDYRTGDIFRLVMVGNLKTIKNHSILIKAMGSLGKDYSLDIYGFGYMERKLRKLATELGVNVSFKGGQKDLYKIIPSYDAFVMTSFSEGHSIALLEAMALRMPLVLSDIPSFRETTKDHALFFDVNSPSQLADRLKAMKDSESLRKEVADNCHQAALQEATREKYLAVIRELYCIHN